MKFGMVSYAVCIAFVAATGCSTVQVSTDFDPTVDFSSYATYRLAPPEQGLSLSPSADAALRESIKDGLESRGIKEVSDGAADLDVVWHIFTREQVSVQQYVDWGYAYGGAWPDRYGSYRMWGGAPITYTDVNSYTEGTLVLDFVDTGTLNLVFRGEGTGTVGSPQANAKSIREAVRKVLSDFPVQPQAVSNDTDR